MGQVWAACIRVGSAHSGHSACGGSGCCSSASRKAGAVAGHFLKGRDGFGAVMSTAVWGAVVVCRSMSVQGESVSLHVLRRAHGILRLEHVKAVSKS